MGDVKRNRRNYYRILHVQPEAPPEIITAAYRTLMGPLGQHPDRGGSHEAAALLNEAYAVLGDDAKRRDYDRLLRKERMRRPAAAVADDTGETGAAPDPSRWQQHRHCPFCRVTLTARLLADSVCGRCHSPLSPPPMPPKGMRELFGKRRASRYARSGGVQLTPAWGQAAMVASLVNLSLSGMAVEAPQPVALHQAVRLVDPHLDAVGLVVACRRRRDRYTVHVRFLTLSLARQPGVMVSTRV